MSAAVPSPFVDHVRREIDLQNLTDDARCNALLLALAYENAMPTNGTDWSIVGRKEPIENLRVYVMTEDQCTALGHAVYTVLTSCRKAYDVAIGEGGAS